MVTLFLFAHAHTRMSGVDACLSLSIMRCIAFRSGIGLLSFSFVIGSIHDASSLAISSGSSICTAPGFSSSAIWSAYATRFGTLDGSTIEVVNFVIGFINATWSMIWNFACFDFLIGFCPVMTNTGIHPSCA